MTYHELPDSLDMTTGDWQGLSRTGLNQHWFETLTQARELIEEWRKDYNEQRPHTSLGWMTPQAFNTAWQQARAG